ncbi:Uma2 family endonuclease [Krasilnikovia sp. MM14-A1259]|uniref:Uma2 family endonuclease n=1 Tax=Krasilnikovia sp. MM14-A1259 TaxID=3373539 RepID=UPI0037F75A64
MTILLSDSVLPTTGLPLSEGDYFALGPTGARVELWDGSLHSCPRETPRHQLIVGALAVALRAGRADMNILSSVAVRLDPGRIAVPDLVVTGPINLDAPFIEAAAVRLVCEVVSPGSAAVDRAMKMYCYAAAGIPWYLLAEQEFNGLYSYVLKEGVYVQDNVMHLGGVTGVEFGR